MAIRTGSWVERYVVWPLLLAVAAWSVLHLWPAVAPLVELIDGSRLS
jgi:hypothetical protein